MCVIIHKPIGVKIDENILRLCWHANPDGAGFMYTTDGEIQIQKGYMLFEDFLEAYHYIDEERYDMVIHMRYATSGKVCPEQCHPFIVHNRLAFAHYGHIVFDFHIEDESKSDTVVFLDEILRKLPKNFLDYDGVKKLLINYINDSTLLFMDNNSNITIMGGERFSIIRDGCWFSNSSWLFMEDIDVSIEPNVQ